MAFENFLCYIVIHCGAFNALAVCYLGQNMKTIFEAFTQGLVIMKKWIIRHFENYLKLSPWGFLWRITIEGLIVQFLALEFLHLFIASVDRSDFDSLNPQDFFLMAVIFGPFIETLLFQSFPVFLARACKAGFLWQILISTSFFAVAHFRSGLEVGISAGIVGGFYNAFTYVHWRDTSRWKAFWITAVSHSLHNLILTFFILKLI